MSTDKTEEIRARLQGARTGPSDAAFVAHADEDIEYLLNRVEELEGADRSYLVRKALAADYVPREEVRIRDAHIATLEAAGDARARKILGSDLLYGRPELIELYDQWQELRKGEK